MSTLSKKEPFTHINPDGSMIMIGNMRNQYLAVFKTPDGYTVVKDAQSGIYNYSELSSPIKQRSDWPDAIQKYR